ncbi:MAG: hypothetical protein ACOC33_01160 [bacterium]
MEVIKKTIKQALTTGITETCSGDCRVIIPDLNANYYITFSLTAKSLDFGFFDALIPNEDQYVYTVYGTYGVYSSNAIGIGETLLMNDNYI